MENIVLYEDDKYKKFQPLVDLRSVFELRCGILSPIQRLNLVYPQAKINIFTREYLKSATQQRYPKYVVNGTNFGVKGLIVNSRVIINQELITFLNSKDEGNFIVVKENEPIIAYLEGNVFSKFVKEGQNKQFSGKWIVDCFRKDPKVKIYSYSNVSVAATIADLISYNEQALRADFKLLKKGFLVLADINSQVALTNEKLIFIGKRTKVDPFVHLDATNGPIYIGENVTIKSQVVVEGPCFIDDNTIIYPGYIRKNTSIGSNCRVGGEVEGSILLDFTNKYHAGFLGHSYVGEWVNFGAMTTTSDLKNNYGSIRVSLTAGQEFDTKQNFLGAFIGDHVKFGIGSLLPTGCVVGMGSNVFGGKEVLPKFIPAFSWSSDKGFNIYKKDKFLEVVEKVFERRNQKLLLPELKVLEHLYSLYCGKQQKQFS